MSEALKIGLLGLGTVGSGVASALKSDAGTWLAQAAGQPVTLEAVLVRDLGKPRNVEIDPRLLTTDAEDVLSNVEIPLVIEVLGGEHPAVDYIESALRAGKHVVTANKEALAKHGPRLFALAREHGVQLRFEASVGGGIPVMASLRSLLAANEVTQIRAIINGTTNYILTQMAEAGQSFAEALKDAQDLGYAEPDPTADVEGYDAVYKLAVLSSICFSQPVHPDQIGREGITGLQAADLRHAKEHGYAVKLLAVGRRDADGVEARVAPVLVPATDLLAGVQGVFNAVQVDGNLVGRVLLSGRGAGPGPTASAILGDVAAVLAGQVIDPLVLPVSDSVAPVSDGSETTALYYIRQPIVPGSTDPVAKLLDNALDQGRVKQASVVGNDQRAEIVAFVEASGVEIQVLTDRLAPLGAGRSTVLRVEQ